MNNKKIKIGVICGRFQIDELHEGHKQLIKKVDDESDLILFVLGRTYKSRKNPLDFNSRKEMVNQYSIRNIKSETLVTSLKDHKWDDIWVKNLDRLIEKSCDSWYESLKKYLNSLNKDISNNYEIILYGGRDSFIKTYKNNKGRYKTKFIKTDDFNSTDIRKNITVKQTKDFRSGVIYGQNNLFPCCYSVVDIIVEKYLDSELYILLGQKLSDRNKGFWVFPGGFIDKGDGSARNAAKRELKEETNLDLPLKSFKILDNLEINDWRYEKTENSLFSTVFTTELKNKKEVKAKDDLCNVKWFHYKEIDNIISSTHKNIWELYKIKNKIKL